MKILITFLFLISSPVWANWEFVADNDNGTHFLVDFQNIRKEGNYVRAWVLTNFAKPQRVSGRDILSLRSRYELNCPKEQIRNLAIQAFSNRNASGEVIGADDSSGNWYEPAPRTPDWEILKSVCKVS
jgi:hypothetical protein